MLTEFGKILRKLRIECGELIKDMAEKLGCTASYLSAVEIGKRPVPADWAKIIANSYALSSDEARKLEKAAMMDVKTVKIDISGYMEDKREAALIFARKFKDLDDETVCTIRKLLEKEGGGLPLGVQRGNTEQGDN